MHRKTLPAPSHNVLPKPSPLRERLAALLFLAVWVAGALVASAQTTQLLSLTNTIWRYDANGGELHGTGWETAGYDDSAWVSGRSVLAEEGLPPGVLGTRLNLFRPGSTSIRVTTYWFRVHFDLPADPVALQAALTLSGSMYIDDAYAMYLNGVEIDRYNLPGTLGQPDLFSTTMGTAANPGGDATIVNRTFGSADTLSSLRQGDNVLAVEVHQSGATSSDVSWGLGLFQTVSFAPVITNPNQPTNRVVIQSRSTTLLVQVDAFPVPTYQWYFEPEGGGGFTPIDPLINPTAATNALVIANMAGADAGRYFCRVTNPLGSVDSRTATVGMVVDATPPALIGAAGSATFVNVALQFNEAVDPTTATDEFVYSVTDGVNTLVVSSAQVTLDGQSVVLTTATQTPNTLYTVTVTGIADLVGNPIGASNATQFRSWVASPCGGVLFETFDTSDVSGNSISVVTSHPSFPNNPRDRMMIATFNSRLAYADDTHEQYGGRMRGLFIPDVSGDWVFYLRSDDGSELHLNPTGPSEAGKTLVAAEVGCCDPYRPEGGAFTETSSPFPLVAGQAYYLEALWKEGTSGDYCQVAARLSGTGTPPNTEFIPPGNLGSPAAPANVIGPVVIAEQPLSQTREVNSVVTFTVELSNPRNPPLCFQWRADGQDIPGADQASYSLPATLADSGKVYSVAISTVGASAVSAGATLTVVPDTTPPRVLSAQSSYTNLSEIVVRFSELMNASDAQDLFNYALENFTLSSATLGADGQSVALQLGTPLILGATYQLQVRGGTDLIGLPLAPTNVTFVAGADVPGLAVALSGSQVVISWPAPSAGFLLESAAQIVTPVSAIVWSPVTTAPTIINARNTVTLNLGSGNQVFRLRQ